MSFFSKKETTQKELVVQRKSNFTSYFTKPFLSEVVNKNSSMILYFTKLDGWIGANKVFLQTMQFANIAEFNKDYETIRDMFISESEDIFTQDDKSWLDYIKRYKEGYSLSVNSANAKTLHLRAKVHTSHTNSEIYILELQDVSELHEAQAETQAVEELKTKFLANIGHEFRTPMNGILGFIDLLDKSTLDQKQREYLNMISGSSKNLMTNIETLLDLSQIQANHLSVDSFSFNIVSQMEKIIHSFMQTCENKGIRFLTFIDPKLPRELNGDIKKINQVLEALVHNAIKFTPKNGKIILEIKLLKRALNGDCSISFSIKDSGHAIAEEQLALIEHPFTASNQADGRLGIGLSLANGLVKLLGTDLKIQSKEGQGTYFNFVLNFKESRGQTYRMMPKKRVKVLLLEASQIDYANLLTTYLRSFAIDVVKSNVLDENVYKDIDTLYIVANQNDSSWMFKLGSYSKNAHVVLLLNNAEKIKTRLTHIIDEVLHKPLIPINIAKHLYSLNSLEIQESEDTKTTLRNRTSALVVEDNLINQRLIKILLQEYNITVFTASNGEEAVQQCKKQKFDIIFMDIDMPQKNGIEATKEIKENIYQNSKVPIVALTAMAMDGDRAMLLESGLDDYMSKPLTREKLENILNTYLKVLA